MAKDTIKRDRFKTVAGRRVQKVLDDLESLSKCSNMAIYDYSEQDVKKMMKAINEKLTLVRLSFETTNSKSNKQTFEF
ncbi:MAG: hypothetical protein K0S09_2527 [Sphingobacteriaceae bacterium]|jgi:hypothetical protein|nr:hypothetical protein [Sphingobacteriaceae bacterium]